MHSSTLLISVYMTVSSAFDISFYSGESCRGSPLGIVSQLHVDDGCQKGGSWSGTAQSVVITPDPDKIEARQSVVFYEGDDCNLNRAVATDNTGCITLGPSRNFGSYDVLPGTTLRERGAPEEVNVPALSSDQLQHGDFQEIDGQMWRFQQIAAGTLQGVKAEEWYSGFTAREPNFDVLNFGEDYPFNFTEYDNNPANDEERASFIINDVSANPAMTDLDALRRPWATCRLNAHCRSIARGAGMWAEFYFPRTTQAAVNAIAEINERTAGDNAFRLLMQPVVQQIMIGTAINLITGVITARWSVTGDAPPERGCTSATQYIVIREAINTGVGNTNGIATEIRGVHTGTLIASCVPTGERDPGDLCGAVNTDPSPGHVSRMKRAAIAEIPGYEEWLKTRFDYSL